MNGILIAATSKDGFIADTDGKVKSWTSAEDHQQYSEKRDQYRVQFMGSGTYAVANKQIADGSLRIIMTSSPEKYADEQVPGKLLFSNLSAAELVEKYAADEPFIILGGSYIYQAFYDAGLVSEAYITVEPVELTAGTPLFSGDTTVNDLEYAAYEVTESALNNTGTVLKHYKFKTN